MAAAPSALVRHATSAKLLLTALQQQADTTADLVGSDAAADFLAALEERDRILGELNGIVQAIARERVGMGRERELQIAVLQEVAHTAAFALESHERLMQRTQRERDRLADALERTNHPDSVANQYGAYGAGAARSSGLSVTG
jgi:hypothetical protein